MTDAILGTLLLAVSVMVLALLVAENMSAGMLSFGLRARSSFLDYPSGGFRDKPWWLF